MDIDKKMQKNEDGPNEFGGFPRRTIVKGAAWSIPVIAAATAVPLASASPMAMVKILDLPCIAAGGTVNGVMVMADRNGTSDVVFILPTGYTWADGYPLAERVIGNGPGTFTVPAFVAGTSQGVFTAKTGTAQDVVNVQPLAAYSMAMLGGMNSITDGPDEFRADFTIDVPIGVRPTGLYYNYYPYQTSATTALTKFGGDNSDSVRTSIDQAYGIVHVQSLGNLGPCGAGLERLYIHARGDADVNSVPTVMNQWIIRATWANNPDTTVTYNVLNQYRGAKTGRPVSVNAWDTTTSGLKGYVGPNAQAGWGNVVPQGTTGGVNPFVFHLDAITSARPAAEGNDLTTSLFYQFVHSDGTPASFTPSPRPVTIPSHSDYTSVVGVLLGTADPGVGSSLMFDKPGYWKLLTWPQSSNSQANNPATPAGVAWDPASDMGQQVGSVFWHLPA